MTSFCQFYTKLLATNAYRGGQSYESTQALKIQSKRLAVVYKNHYLPLSHVVHTTKILLQETSLFYYKLSTNSHSKVTIIILQPQEHTTGSMFIHPKIGKITNK